MRAVSTRGLPKSLTSQSNTLSETPSYGFGDNPHRTSSTVHVEQGYERVNLTRGIPIVTFDTSAHNRLVDDGPVTEQVLAKIKSDMFFRFAGVSFEEMYATRDPARRAALMASCRRLQEGESDCLYPQDELLKLLIQAHAHDSAAFNWLTAEVISRGYADEIESGALVNDEELLAEHRRVHREQLKGYRNMFAQLRPKLQPVFEAHGEARPGTYREFLGLLESSDEKLTAGFGKILYDKAAGTDVSKDCILAFFDVCPPFRAFNYALLMSWFDLAVGNESGEKFEAGRNDLFMSIYLPYCDRFVTAEQKAEQEKCLREIVSVAGLATEVISYDDFRDNLLIA